jgi:hypothetical protein
MVGHDTVNHPKAMKYLATDDGSFFAQFSLQLLQL